MVGRRLSDGAVVAEPASDQLRWIVSSVLLLVAAGSCPSHDSFTAYLGAMAQHPSDLLGGLSAIVESVHIAVAATSSSWVVLRIGRFRSDPYLGVFGTWFPLPSLDVPWPSFDVRWPSSLATDPWGMVCSGGRSPHESFVLLCLLGFAMWRLVPRAMHRHAVCSLRAVQEGRVWVLLSANVSHASVLHLLHNALQLMHFGPILHASLGCERLVQLLALASLASSTASLAWHGLLRDRRAEGSIGASGVAMALVAANAALYPHTRVRMYGAEMAATQQLVAFLVLDTAMGWEAGADVSSHLGGAASGWAFVQWWRRSRAFW